jgi:regulator of protease activity HflC (stomatin/prohibitin superfamily)
MFYISFYKGSPSDYVIKFKNGKSSKNGRGISFLYSRRKTNIISIPAKTIDAYFAFNEMTKTYQPVTIQGQLTYRITDFDKISKLLDFTINPKTKVYNTNDNEKLTQRIVNAVQMSTKDAIKDLSLEETLSSSALIASKALLSIKDDASIQEAGVEVAGIHISSIKPKPETSNALEADYRETLLKKADEAIYSRRAAAVEQEKFIKENEINSQIEMEKKKKELVNLEGENLVKEAEYTSKAKELEVKSLKELGPSLLLALGFKQMGEKVTNISNLNITPELLTEILDLKRR